VTARGCKFIGSASAHGRGISAASVDMRLRRKLRMSHVADGTKKNAASSQDEVLGFQVRPSVIVFT
jgi:hypothetical protein